MKFASQPVWRGFSANWRNRGRRSRAAPHLSAKNGHFAFQSLHPISQFNSCGLGLPSGLFCSFNCDQNAGSLRWLLFKAPYPFVQLFRVRHNVSAVSRGWSVDGQPLSFPALNRSHAEPKISGNILPAAQDHNTTNLRPRTPKWRLAETRYLHAIMPGVIRVVSLAERLRHA